MPLLAKLAFRNLWRHRGQSLVIGTILFLGAFLMTLGNGIITGMERGLRRTVAHGFTGDLVLLPEAQKSDNVFMEMMGRAIEPLYGYPAIRSALEASPQVADHLPIGKGTVMILNEDDGPGVFLYLIGADLARYDRVFPGNLRLLEGAMPHPGEPGLLLPTGARNDIQKQSNLWFRPKGPGPDTADMEADARAHAADLSRKTEMVLMGFNDANTATDIRLPVNGIFRYRALNTIFGAFALADIESYRRCTGFFTALDRPSAPLARRDSALLEMDEGGLDRLLGGDLPEADPPPAAVVRAPAEGAQAPAAAGSRNLEEGAYNMVLVVLKEGADGDRAAAALNRDLAARKLPVRAVTWQKALGPIGSMATLIKGALTLFVAFLFMIAAIIIVNTLTMAAMERTPELGMMRAIGARKSFITRMFLAETSMLALLFGGAGIALAALATLILAAAGITSENDMLQLAFGGDTFRPFLAPSDFLLAAAQLAMATLVAVIYPVWMARRVTPLDAVYRE